MNYKNLLIYLVLYVLFILFIGRFLYVGRKYRGNKND